MKIAGLGAVASTFSASRAVMAGPFSKPDSPNKPLIPADKKLSPEWVRNLFAKGEPEIYRGKDLATLGMPVGGIGAGQLYLLGDGTLGCWQIANKPDPTGVGTTNYEFRTPESPVDHGFAVIATIDGQRIGARLRHQDFPEVAFRGEYPIGRVTYHRQDLPIDIEMEAFSPFIPLNAKDSAIPATLFHITVENTSDTPVTVNVLGWLENAVCYHSVDYIYDLAQRRTRIVCASDHSMIVHSAQPLPTTDERPARPRPPIILADFEGEDFGDWTVEGKAFGSKPAHHAFPPQKESANIQGKGYANSYSGGDKLQGKLTSPPFEINRKFLNFSIGGGRHPYKCCVNLIVEGEVIYSETGNYNEDLRWKTWPLARFMGKQGQVEIVDLISGGWGHINADFIELADEPRVGSIGPIEQLSDFGSMALTLAGPAATPATVRDLLTDLHELPEHITTQSVSTRPMMERYSTAIATPAVEIEAHGKRTLTFVLSWHFPNRDTFRQDADTGQMYDNWFKDAGEVARYVLKNHERLATDTRKWRDTYYDSTLPIWLLNRLHSTVANLATGTAQWWKNGRFWAWEGVYCCTGTCTHVWNYAHAVARLFPELERSARQMQDLGVALHDDGLVGFRGKDHYAADGQVGTILKCYREHLMSADDAFLKRNWDKIKKALEYSIVQDENDDGLIENSQHNTFDLEFFGPNTFVGSLYLAALRAGEEMAKEVGDTDFAKRARALFESGSRLSMEKLWNGEYFIQLVDLEKHTQRQYAQGCLSDQLFGQGWAHQIGLGYLYPKENVRQAAASIWKYNWAPDVSVYNAVHKPWRYFATAGEAGLLTCTWPKSEYLEHGLLYCNEVWTGGEYQLAGHLIWEGMITEGLAICRAAHDRYHPAKHNPYNEVECGDHYARALASWGVFIALAGYKYHGPKGFLSFSPKLTPEHFRSAFTTAEGWGTFEQKREGDTQSERIIMRWGKLRLQTLAFTLPDGAGSAHATVKAAGTPIEADCTATDGQATVTLTHELTLNENDMLDIELTRT